MLGDVNKLFGFKSLLTLPSNIFLLHLQQTFPPIIWIFTEGEGDRIETMLPFEIFSTLTYQLIETRETLSCSKHSCWSNQIPLLYITCPVQWKARTHIALSQKNFYFLFFSQNIFMLHFKPYQKKDILLKVLKTMKILYKKP